MKKKMKNPTKKKFPKFMQKKLVLLFGAIILAFIILIGRITFINASNGDKYSKIVLDQQQYDSRVIPYRRGDIVDRNNTKIATSERVYNVILDVKVMLSNKDYEKPTTKVLKECFGIEQEIIETVIKDSPNSRYSILQKGVSYEKSKEFEEIDKDDKTYPNVKGIWLENDYKRAYPYNNLASDVIGFTADGNLGTGGLEAYYNNVLNGTDGREYGYLETESQVEKTIKEPVDGNTLVSTIDVQVQNVVEKHILAFNETGQDVATYGARSKNTAVIVMNPQNGEILAEASYPNFDLNNPRDLSKHYTEETLETMTEAEKIERLNTLWNNFCVSDTYEPGSTIKPFTVAAGLETGVLTGEEYFNCGGYLHIGEHDIYCIRKTGHGSIGLKQSIEDSCNVSLMRIGEMLGVEELCKYQRIFGFGARTGVDLPGDVSTESLLYTPETMDVASLATNAFGQNFNVTMTQMAAGFSSLVNGGAYYQPRIVKQIEDKNGNVIESKHPVLVKRTISEETGSIVKDEMRGVVLNGSGKAANLEEYEVGGKTGTAEKHPRSAEKYLLSFIGYAPQENPEVIVYVVIDEVSGGGAADSTLAVQMAADIMKEIFPYLGVTKIAQPTE